MTGLLSILIITYNREEDTLDLLKSLQRQIDYAQYVGEVLVLNNASTVSYELLKDFVRAHPELKIRYIDHNENLGVARGRNYLIQEACCPLLLVLDDDVVFEDEYGLRNAAQALDHPLFTENNTAVLTFSIFYYDTNTRQLNAFPHKDWRTYETKHQFLTAYFIGAAHLMKRELFEQTGLYPTDFFYGAEEYDLSFRILNAGYTIGYSDVVKIRHKESPLGRVPNSQKLSMMWYNKSAVAWKYLPKKYFYSTAVLWSLFFLRKSGFDLKNWFKTWPKIFSIPRTKQQQTISPAALDYIAEVKGRLWY